MEYRKGRAMQQHVASAGMNITINETTEAFRIAGVTFAKKYLAQANTKHSSDLKTFVDMIIHVGWKVCTADTMVIAYLA